MNQGLSEPCVSEALSGEGMSGYDELYQKYYSKVFGLCLRMTANETEAEDLAQDVFVILSSKLESFRGDSNFRTWLHRLTINSVLMRFRKRDWRCQRQAIDCSDEENVFLLKHSHNPESSYNAAIDLERAIKSFPLGYRRVLVNIDLLGFEHTESAARLGHSQSTSKTQLFKARRRMREALPGY